MGGSKGPSGRWGFWAFVLVVALPVLAYMCGRGMTLGELIGWPWGR